MYIEHLKYLFVSQSIAANSALFYLSGVVQVQVHELGIVTTHKTPPRNQIALESFCSIIVHFVPSI